MSFKGVSFAIYILSHSYLISDTTATIPKMKAVHANIVARQDSNVTLTCRGREVHPIDTEVQWKFNGQIIKENTNKKAKEKYLLPDEKRKGLFSLHITNVSEKDVGKYSCVAYVANFGKPDFAEAIIDLKLCESGVDGILPVLRPVHPIVLTNEGSNATLTCVGRKVNRIDTVVSWKFNGKEVQENTNKKVIEIFLPRRRGNFSLHITNVSAKDVGKYTCIAYVANFGKPDTAEAIIDLKLYERVEWPKGTYAIPMPYSGCPVSTEFSWSEGLLRQDTEDSRPLNNWSSSIHLNGEKRDSKISQHFCVKTNKSGKTQWPAGKYCIYKKGKCPYGFREGWIKWDDEDTKNDNFASGVLPDGTYSKDTVIHYCCRSDGSAETPVELPMREPFFLLKHSNSCQAVLGMRVTEEWMFWDCEDRENKNSFDGEIPQSFIAKDIRLYFCYYIKK